MVRDDDDDDDDDDATAILDDLTTIPDGNPRDGRGRDAS